MKKLIYLLKSIPLFFLFSCATEKPNHKLTNINDQIFEQEIIKFEKDIKNYDMEILWNKYLKSTQIENTLQSQSKFDKIKLNYDSGKLSCNDINFFKIIHRNYWSIKPHIFAMDCYSSLKQTYNASLQQDIIKKILQWSFSTGNGAHIKTPIQTATAGDAQDIIELSGYSLIDQYIVPFAGFQSMRYAFIVLDNESKKQQTLFFSNDDFMFALYGEDYKLGSYDILSIISTLANKNSNYIFKNGLANVLISIKNYKDAEHWFNLSAESGSVYANTQLAKLCLTKKLTINTPENCISYLTVAAKKEYTDAFLYLSALYSEGIGVDTDLETSRQFMTLARKKSGAGVALMKLATLYKSQVFGKNLENKSLALYQQAVKNNNADAAIYLYLYYKKKKNVAKRKYFLNKAIELKSPFAYSFKAYEYLYSNLNNKALQKSKVQLQFVLNKFRGIVQQGISKNDPLSFFIMGKLYDDKNFGKLFYDKKRAFKYFLKGAKLWDPGSLYEVSNALTYPDEYTRARSKIELKKNYQRALKWSVRCAKSGNSKCALNSGYLLDGKAYNDPTQAARYYLIAAKDGLSYGQDNYGSLLRKGKGIKKNLSEAETWLLKAAKQKNPHALNELGLLYEEQGNLEKAVQMFNKAIHYHYSYAYYNIARFYEKGLWFNKNIQMAKKWYLKAAKYGHPSARTIAESLSKS